MIYSEDAPSLENLLHQAFDHRRVNMVNPRKEFFRVSLTEIQSATRDQPGEMQFTLVAEAEEYRKTLSLLDGHDEKETPATEAGKILEQRKALWGDPDSF